MLTHNDPDPVVLRPANVMKPAESLATVKDRERPDVTANDPAVKKAQAKLDRMLEVNAAAPVIAKHRALVEAARVAFLEKAAEKVHAERTKILDAQRTKRNDEITRETTYRLGKPSEIALKLVDAVLVTIHVDRSMDMTARQHAIGDVQRAMQIQIRESEKAARRAAAGQPTEIDAERLARELQDVCRRSIRNGDCLVEIL